VTLLVVDASTLLSTTVAKRDSPLAVLLDAVTSGAIEIVAGDELLSELHDGLESTYFRDRVSAVDGRAYEAMIASLALHLPDPVSPPKILRDSDDDYLVALALAANATAIVTGDRDLLDHENLKPPALSARQACEMLGLPAS
jgi:putative PIN family toxin of toxin-antitoxin system